MPNLTQNLGLKKPLLNETADIDVLNENFDAIDSAIAGKAPASHTHTKADVIDIDTITTDINEVTSVVGAHLANSMPHKFTDADTGKIYKWGLAMQNGEIGIIYEEVI